MPSMKTKGKNSVGLNTTGVPKITGSLMLKIAGTKATLPTLRRCVLFDRKYRSTSAKVAPDPPITHHVERPTHLCEAIRRCLSLSDRSSIGSNIVLKKCAQNGRTHDYRTVDAGKPEKIGKHRRKKHREGRINGRDGRCKDFHDPLWKQITGQTLKN